MRNTGFKPKNIDDYLSRVPEPARSTLAKVRLAIRSAVPREAVETISYGMPAFRCNGMLVGFAAFPKHCGFYPMDPAVIDDFAEDLKEYETSKGTIRFPSDKPLPAALVKKIVKARVAADAGLSRKKKA